MPRCSPSHAFITSGDRPSSLNSYAFFTPEVHNPCPRANHAVNRHHSLDERQGSEITSIREIQPHGHNLPQIYISPPHNNFAPSPLSGETDFAHPSSTLRARKHPHHDSSTDTNREPPRAPIYPRNQRRAGDQKMKFPIRTQLLRSLNERNTALPPVHSRLR